MLHELIVCAVAAPEKQRRWTAHTAPDGRTYYYNKETKKSVWVKPPDFEAFIEVRPTGHLPALPAYSFACCPVYAPFQAKVPGK